MEQRYLFKGKTIVGDWVIGLLANNGDKWYISNNAGRPFAFEIRPDTICQCTGLKDKNGKLIWENDIVKFEDYGEEQGPEYKEGYEYENNARVEFAEGRWSLTDFADDNSAVMDNHAEFTELWSNSEVIGNKFDSPEMLEV